LLRGPLLKV